LTSGRAPDVARLGRTVGQLRLRRIHHPWSGGAKGSGQVREMYRSSSDSTTRRSSRAAAVRAREERCRGRRVRWLNRRGCTAGSRSHLRGRALVGGLCVTTAAGRVRPRPAIGVGVPGERPLPRVRWKRGLDPAHDVRAVGGSGRGRRRGAGTALHAASSFLGRFFTGSAWQMSPAAVL
jgi:hypothetical protein